MSENLENSKTGILLLSHGSRLPYGSNVINSLADMYKEEFPDSIIEIGFMEMGEPNIPQAFENLKTKADLDKVIVVPVFIAHGLHTKRDIPKILGLESIEEEPHNHEHHHHHHHEHEKVDFDGEIIFTDPLEDDPLVLEIIKKRISSSI
ncbi:sirohydrochlorin nickelochelatase [Methanobrevibacter sp. OttesenSCG-928-K11]|nr:sirohydrochlorin nickelochelatase [Methanobrevibacter sp. OttesenSCG-928-K11]MDL2270375.1 sirohydrochlorin nickelochelatase [Methanobrevibacter sp. OttesenSCG-928-I08]